MTAETQTLNFGPEWLRALSSGGSVISPPLSPALPKYKLADYRYGREEMLALYIKDNKVPSDLLDKEFQPILKEEPLLPLALVPFTEEEQRNFSMSVNSSAVLRLMGRGSGGGGGTVVGAPRGRSSSRGRGRGRGEGGFYQRSFDEVESGFGRGAREMHRSQSWEERGDRRFEKTARKEPARPTFEEGGAAPAGRKPEFGRFESWRSLREELNGEEEDGGGVWRTAAPRREGERWRSHSPDGVRGPGWREHPDRRRRFDFDIRERDDERGYRRTRSGSGGAEDERDSLPEWCLEDAEDETGTFDSSGAFLPSKKVQKEPIPEEQELDFRPSVEDEERSESDESISEEAKEADSVQEVKKANEVDRKDSFGDRQAAVSPESERRAVPPAKMAEPVAEQPVQKTTCPPASHNVEQEVRPQTPPKPPTPPNHKEDSSSHGPRSSCESSAPCIPQSTSPVFNQSTAARQVKDPQGTALHSLKPAPVTIESTSGSAHPSLSGAPGMGSLPPEPDEEDRLQHLEQQAQQMVAYLQDGTLDDDRLTGKLPDHRAKGPSLDNQQKWYYKDPQGEIQGPFSNREMAEWYQAGYFPMSLLLRRVCDEAFQSLGDIIKLWGRVPFITPPVPRLGELAPEHIGRHQEITALYQLQQLHYQQFLLQQQYAQVMAQQQKAALSSQQQQQVALLLQQFQALKMRLSEQTVVPAVPRATPVPDNTSVWELQTAAPPQPTMWEGSSVWDLPVEPTSQGASREQLEQMEKAKAAKIEQERREAELRAKQEEEERRRRLEEEESKRKEELELARRKQEEALRRQREQELALRRQMEEEERKREEERRLLEERRRQEEERRRQEEERRRLEEERKRIEEERQRKEEEKKREEEERRQREELQRKQEEAARWAREEEEAARRLQEEARVRQEEEERKKREEAQRQKELQRQRQQQQEALRRLQQQQQQQQLAQMKLPSSSTWGQQVNSALSSQSALSLAEIQKLEEERERQNQEEVRRQQQEIKSMHQQLPQQQKVSGWGTVGKSSGNTKSLLEIQQEEARQMQKVQQQVGRSRPANITLPPAPVVSPPQNITSSVSSSGSSVWGSLNNNLSPQWSSDSISSIWNSPESKSTSGGFWDDVVKVVAPPKTTTNKNKNNASKPSGVNSRQSKKVEQEEKLVRLFQGANKCADGFTQWCEQTLHSLNTAHNLDVHTFVSFLREVESPIEVRDYVCEYLGDTPEAKDFSKQFLERRNKQKTTVQKPPQVSHTSHSVKPVSVVYQESGWGINQISQNNSQPTMLETAQSAGRKKKKQKMVRADPSLLGFSVNASSERLNMGEIETLEDY
ncbi:GRB10-interacting GYF protein 2 isoform X3 [Hyperolius riggenbachi]|uniref:GRB10-interacting GYF protein 2 isoform X3 n=1 Tax=Hyperolius riggenbachi TaxID=752182 RepID=UPI0035A36444